MKIAIKSTRSLGGAVLLTFVGLAGWSALPERFRTWLEPTAHAGAMIFVVNSAADPGDGTCNASNCTLREAINAANSNLGLDTINFNIAGAGVKTINLTSALPTITAPVQIFGVTQPGYASAPLIELNGAGAGTGAHGIQITGGGSFVVALTINRFGGDGVRISGAGGNFVLDNYIGTNNAGSASQGNAGAGVRVTGSPNNTVGGGFCASFLGCSESQLKYGVISGNGGNGVVIEGVGATGNVVQRSYIGTNAGGTADLGNRFSGVILLNEASNNIIGGTTTSARNVISGNDSRGVSISGSGNQVLGNYIGTNAAGNAALSNNLGGVSVGGVNNTLGGTASGARNIISGNGSSNVLVVTSDPNTRVQGNYIGTDSSGTVALTNPTSGVVIDGSENITIGGPEAGAGNVISGHTSGIFIRGTSGGGTGNKIQGNLIGTNAAGTARVPNSDGVRIQNARGNTIGGTVAGARNVISGNGLTGVNIIAEFGGNDNLVLGNYVGTTAAGDVALGNGTGVRITGPSNNIIGGTVTGARNVISGNFSGVVIENFSDTIIAKENKVLGNYIGTDVTGTLDVGNSSSGVIIQGGDNNLIGGTTAAARNIISGNNLSGVKITNSGSVGGGNDNIVRGNYIGTTTNGMQALGNSRAGVSIDGNVGRNVIGGTIPGAGNLISGNVQNGIEITGGGGQGNQVQGNLIGTNAAGNSVLGNDGFGVLVTAPDNTIGGTVGGARNVISGNNSGGVSMGAGGNRVQGNYIGTDASGTIDLGNSGDGVDCNAGTTIGGTTPEARNVISGNNQNGIFITGTQNQVQGNFIGTNAAGTQALPNSGGGVIVLASNNTIGGTVAGARNVISGNTSDGVEINGGGVTGNRVEGNFIGTDVNGTADLGNNSNGVHIRGNATGNFVGGTMPGARNIVAFNGGDGVFIQPGNVATKDNAVLSNSIFSNTGLGIDLFPDGVTPNDAGDADTGANNLQNFPALTSAIAFPSSTTASGTLNSTANTAFRLELFSNVSCDPSGNGEGQMFIGAINVTTDAGGNASFTSSTLTAGPAGRFITATATDPTGNTSEFSQCLQARTATSDLSINMVDSPDPVMPGSTLTYTITLTNNGPDRAESVVLTNNLPADVAFITCSSTGAGVCGGAGNNRTVTFSSLAASEVVSVTLVTRVNSSMSGGTISNTATVSSPVSDPNTANNSMTIATTVSATPTPSTLQFSAASYSVVEDCTRVSISVTRSGPVTGAATVDYATANATASERSDYTTALGTLRFAAGETSKTFDLLINEDSYVEGTETATIILSNPAGGILGNPNTAMLEIIDDASEPATNPIDQAQNFACQNYHDFLNRQPDAAGLAFWTNQITECGTDAQCIEIRRINVSAAFFLSIEFQETGYLVYRFHQTAFAAGPLLRIRNFLADTQEIGRGVVVGAPGWEQQLEANKQAYANAFAARPQFVAQYPTSMTAGQFVDALNANTPDPQNPGTGGSLSQSELDQLVADLNSNAKTRAQVVRAVAEDADFNAREFNRAFVYMQYVGYLRRNPNDPPDNNLDGYNFWLGKLNQFNGNFVQAEMVKAFIVSSEYRGRFAN